MLAKIVFMLSAIGDVLTTLLLIFLVKAPAQPLTTHALTEFVPEILDLIPEPAKAIERAYQEHKDQHGK